MRRTQYSRRTTARKIAWKNGRQHNFTGGPRSAFFFSPLPMILNSVRIVETAYDFYYKSGCARLREAAGRACAARARDVAVPAAGPVTVILSQFTCRTSAKRGELKRRILFLGIFFRWNRNSRERIRPENSGLRNPCPARAKTKFRPAPDGRPRALGAGCQRRSKPDQSVDVSATTPRRAVKCRNFRREKKCGRHFASDVSCFCVGARCVKICPSAGPLVLSSFVLIFVHFH